MKIAIRIFLIITYVYSGLILLSGLSYLTQGTLGTEDMISLASAAIAIPVSIIAHVKLERATSRKELIPIAIVTLLLGNAVAGILMLCISDRSLMPKNQQFNPYQNPYGNPYNPYGSPYGNTYNGPYGNPYNQNTQQQYNPYGQYQNPNGQYQNPNGQYQNPYNQQYNPNGQPYQPNNQYQNPGNTYGSPYGNPTGTPFTAPQNEPKEEPAQPTEDQDNTPNDQE